MVIRVDAKEKVTGKALYADDLVFDRMLYAAPLHAAYPSALIISINTQPAMSLKGVVDIITAQDIPGLKQVGTVIKDHYVLATDRVRYSGDVVAMVVAESAEIAREAAKLIRVEYQPLKPIFSPEEALSDDAPAIHDRYKNNIPSSYKVRHGDIKKGFAKSDKIIEREFRTTFVEHAYMEPESCIAIKNPDGSITVYGGMQHPFTTRRFVAWACDLPLNRVQIIQTTLGGGFGGKDDTISMICARAAILALRTERPVKITYTREESIRESYKRHPFHLKYKVGVDKKGKLQAEEISITADSGAYCATSPFVIWRPTVQCTGPYIVPNVKCDTRAVYTNNTFTGAMRGFGSPQVNFAIESMTDIVAHEIGMDPIEFRRRNFFTQGCVTHTGQKFNNHKVSISEVVDKVLKRIDWKKKYALSSRGKPDENGNYYGIGLACSYRGVSLGAEGNDFCAAIVNIQPDGSIILEVGVAENGQGLKTAMVHILATEFGVGHNRIRFLDTDTSSITDSCPTVASRGTLVGGNAILDAVKKIKEQMRPVLEELIGAPHPSPPPPAFAEATAGKRGGRVREGVKYIYKNGRITNPKTRRSISFEDAVAACHNKKMYLYALGVFQGPPVHWKEDTGQGNAYFTYVYGCQAAELTVDGKTGKVAMKKVVAAHEVGKAINPQMAIGQIIGGVAMGLGFALKEAIIHKDGVIQNTNFDKYKILTAPEMPEVEAILVENPDPAGPWGAKALGEPVNELMGAAIANAIFNATGVRFLEVPITAEKIWNALTYLPQRTQS
jgi:CO/xanthine dehydrogenase Mo-binding subunit